MRTTTLAIAVLAISMPAMVPAQTAPPIKMGLWEGTTVTKMTGLNIPPDMAERLKAMGRPVPGAEPRTMHMQSCLTAEKWKDMFTHAQNRENCQVTNVKQDASGMSADMACHGTGGGGATGHMQMSFLSTEKVHGTMHMEASSAQQPQPIVVDVTIDSAYLGDDCKGVSPDTPKIIMK